MKVALIVFSDPKTGTEEALARVFNALGAAHEFRQSGHVVVLYFQGTGARWPALLQDEKHPAHQLYQSVRDVIGGVSCGCADAFSSQAEIQQTGLQLVKDNPVPGTNGIISLSKLLESGYQIIQF